MRDFLALGHRLAGFLIVSIVISLCVSLSVDGQDGTVPPVADFTYWPILPNVGEPVFFNGSASYDPNGFIYRYSWDFGDGNVTVTEGPEIEHVYLERGEYDVTLLVTDSCLLTNSTTKTILVGQHVLASFSYFPLEPYVNEPVAFDASNSTASDGVIVSYTWSFGDGSENVVDTPFISHSYAEAKVYSVTLNVTSSSGEWDVASQNVNVTSPPTVPPKALFTWSPEFPEAGQPVQFNASDSTPDGGEITSYIWDFSDGSIVVVTEPIVTHVFENSGNYNVYLNVTDSEGLSGVNNKTVAVIAKPVADFFFNPAEPRVCQIVTFNASISDPRGGEIVRFEWNFGDDSAAESGVEVSHRFRAMGEYTVYLNVTDSENMSDVKSVTLRILPHIADLNEDGVVDVLDLAIFGKAFGSFPGHQRWDPRADLNGNNIINILDGAIIARCYNMCIDPFDPPCETGCY